MMKKGGSYKKGKFKIEGVESWVESGRHKFQLTALSCGICEFVRPRC